MASALLATLYVVIPFILMWVWLKRTPLYTILWEKMFWWGLFGLTLNIFTFSFLYSTLPLPWLTRGWGFLVVTCVYLLLIALSFISYLFVGVADWYARKRSSPVRLLIIACAVVVAEFVRSFLIPLTLSGKGTLLGFHFASWTLGNALGITPLVEFAYIGGVFSLAFMIVALTGLIAFRFTAREKAVGYGVITVTFLVLHFLVPVHGPDKERVALIGTQTGTTYQSKTLSFLEDAIGTSSPSIIVMPEDSRTLNTNEDFKKIAELFPDTVFIDGNSFKTGTGRKNTSLYYDTELARGAYREKGNLSPFGEYVPTAFREILSFAMSSSSLSAYEDTYSYSSGSLPVTITTKRFSFAPLLCSELYSYSSLFPLLWHPPQMVFIQSSLSWFHNNQFFLLSYESSARIASAMLRTPVLVASNDAPSYAINARGALVSKTATGEKASVYDVDSISIKRGR